MKYWEQLPNQRLSRHLECFWFVSEAGELTSANPVERVLPDGCLEWIFHLGAPYERATLSGEWELQPRSFIVGQLTRFILLRSQGRIEIMGVRFKPAGAYRFLPFPLDSFNDTNIPTADIWGREGRHLEQQVLEASDHAQRQQLLEQFLANMIVQTTAHPRLDAAVDKIISSRGQTRIRELAAQTGLSSRQLEREFRAGVGLSPKAFARTMRFQNLLRLAGEGTLRDWADLACEGGYCDQPHMVREFRDFAGQSPAERQLARAGDLASCFISPTRLATLLGPS